jgi:hypothetical protein
VTFSKKIARLLIWVGILLLISAQDAFAYIDPGTGSFVLQLVIASLLGAAFAVKAFWKNIKAFFSKLLSKG